MSDPRPHFERYVAGLSDREALDLHRIVCRRAAAIYGPMYQAKRDANWRMGMAASRSYRDARAATRAPERQSA